MKSWTALDIFSKTADDFRIRTGSGAMISIAAAIFIFYLFLSEFYYFIKIDTQHELSVDTNRDTNQKLQINFNITFHKMACDYMTLDVMDVSGEQHLDVEGAEVYRMRLNEKGNPIGDSETSEINPSSTEHPKAGDETVAETEPLPANYCGSCYGALPDGECCNTCEKVREAYRIKGWAFSQPQTMEQCQREGFLDKLHSEQREGCMFWGVIYVNKVAGNFHFAPGKSFMQNRVHIHDLQPFKGITFNLSHTIGKLSFGVEYPGVKNPLDKMTKRDFSLDGSMYQYFLKVIPTEYMSIGGTRIETNQFSVTTYQRGVIRGLYRGLPGVFFMYDVSPIKIDFREKREHFSHFITNLCAIIGGVFTVAGFLDRVIYKSIHSIRGKFDIGKLQ